MDQRGNRRGSFHRIGQPDVEWNLCRLAASADEQQQARCRNDGIADTEQLRVSRQCRDLRKSKRSEIPDDGEHAQQKTGITDAVYDECLIGSVVRGFAMEIKSY